MAYYSGQKVKYKKPGRISSAKIIIVIVLLAAVYLTIAFLPPYYRYWKAQPLIKEETNKAYSLRHRENWDDEARAIEKRLKAALVSLTKVDEETMHVKVVRTKTHIRVRAKWVAKASYPLIGLHTNLHFSHVVKLSREN